jgi:NADH-quinone oxidoreductase subunit C
VPAGDADAAKARAEARAARAAGRAVQTGAASEPEASPSPMQPQVDRAAELIRGHVGADAVVEAYINERDGHRPCLVIAAEEWPATSRFLKENEELGLTYLRNVAGVDLENQLEVVYHLLSLESKHEYCVKVRTDREVPSIPSATPVWETANWQEREIYDLLGIDFPGHPDLRRIMMPDDWDGYPLRKDYVPLDPEV